MKRGRVDGEDVFMSLLKKYFQLEKPTTEETCAMYEVIVEECKKSASPRIEKIEKYVTWFKGFLIVFFIKILDIERDDPFHFGVTITEFSKDCSKTLEVHLDQFGAVFDVDSHQSHSFLESCKAAYSQTSKSIALADEKADAINSIFNYIKTTVKDPVFENTSRKMPKLSA